MILHWRSIANALIEAESVPASRLLGRFGEVSHLSAASAAFTVLKGFWVWVFAGDKSPAYHPSNVDLFVGTPGFHLTDEDLSVGILVIANSLSRFASCSSQPTSPVRMVWTTF